MDTTRELSQPETDAAFPTGQLPQDLALLRQALGSSPDVVYRRFQLGEQRDAVLVFIRGLADQERIESTLLLPLLQTDAILAATAQPEEVSALLQRWTTCGALHYSTGFTAVTQAILSGIAALLVDGLKEACLFNARVQTVRPIKEPAKESANKSARDGFIESLDLNLALLRQKVKSANLRFEPSQLGVQSSTDLVIAYLQGIASDDLITEIKTRLNRIRIDAIISSGQIEELIRDMRYSPFPTISFSERPDVVAARLLEGRAAILIDGTPIVLTMPTFFLERFQSPDDYSYHFLYATLIRWTRFFGFLLTIFAPALYVALISYHPELIPTPLLITMSAAAEGTPFPAVVEALLMGLTVEVLREAGRWMPGTTGAIVTVLGLAVVGEALVTSGLVGAPFVIVVAVTLVASFLVPNQEDISPFIRLILVLLSGMLGLYGLMLGFIVIYIHLATLRSFGLPYLSSLTPLNLLDAKDTLIRAPWWKMNRRPTLLSLTNPTRQDNSSPSRPPQE